VSAPLCECSPFCQHAVHHHFDTSHVCVLRLRRLAPARAGEGNVAIWGTPPDSIDDAEDRDKWYELLTRLDIRQPPGGMVTSEEGALAEAAKLGYPARPGRALPL